MPKHLIVNSIILLMVVGLFAQDNQPVNRGFYEIPDYNGGINVQSDSASLQMNQGLVMENFIFSSYGALKKRNSYGYWNRVPFPTGDTVKDFHHLYRSKGSNQLLIATNNYLYVSPFTDTVTVDASWPDVRIGYNKGTVDAYDDSNLVYGTDTWWLLSIKIGDLIEIDNDSIFTIDSIIADTCVELDRKYQSVGDHDTASSPYQIYRTIVGDPYITSWNSNGYIADDQGSGFYYADSQCLWLNCVDSGTVDSSTNVENTVMDSTPVVVQVGYITIPGEPRTLCKSITIKGTSPDALCDSLRGLIDDGMWNIKIRHENAYHDAQITREIIDYHAECLFYADATPPDPTVQWYIDSSAHIWNFATARDSVVIIDSSKVWDMYEHVNNYMVSGNKPHLAHYIADNTSSVIEIKRSGSLPFNQLFPNDSRYYIYESIPYGMLHDSLASPKYKQFMFHKNILYAFGFSLDENSDTVDQGFIYHSDIGLPKTWISFEGFDLSLNAQDRPTSFFKLHDDLMISTNNSIYKLMGWPPAIGNGVLVEALYGTGIDSYNSVVNRNNRKSYLARKDGFYTFDGNNDNKISLLIDPLIDKYRTSDYELGYFDENVYFSFIDSNKTFMFHEPTQTFTSLAFGISVFDNQATLIDSSYFLFSHPSIVGGDSSHGRHIFKYPTSGYSDTPDTLGAYTIPISYKTGWMDFGSPNIKKQFDKFYINTVKRSDSLWVRFRVDFDTTTHKAIPIADSVSLRYSYRFMNILDLPSTLQGRYLQIEIDGDSGQEHTIGTWGVEFHAVSKD